MAGSIKRPGLIGVVALVLAWGLFYGLAAEAAAATYIGEAKAEAIALAHAQVSKSEVRGSKVKLDSHRGKATYEVEFDTASMEYEYEIDAVTGEILEYEADRH